MCSVALIPIGNLVGKEWEFVVRVIDYRILITCSSRALLIHSYIVFLLL